MQANLICAECQFFNEPKLNCKAFMDGIPDIILSGENDHSKPLPNQKKNIIFEPINK